MSGSASLWARRSSRRPSPSWLIAFGATTMPQLEEDIAAAQFELDAEVLADIAAVQARYPNPAG